MPSDDELRHAVLEGVLARAPKEGFTREVLRAATEAAGVSEDVFPGGVGEALAAWSAEIDAELEQRLKAMDLPALPIRKRIRSAVLARLELLKPHKEAARKAAAALALPQYIGLGPELLWHSADIMWRAAGDSSTDFNFYTKRGILAGVISSTLVTWFGDDSLDERHTAAFLDARIDNVLQFEKLKARFRDVTSGTAS